MQCLRFTFCFRSSFVSLSRFNIPYCNGMVSSLPHCTLFATPIVSQCHHLVRVRKSLSRFLLFSFSVGIFFLSSNVIRVVIPWCKVSSVWYPEQVSYQPVCIHLLQQIDFILFYIFIFLLRCLRSFVPFKPHTAHTLLSLSLQCIPKITKMFSLNDIFYSASFIFLVDPCYVRCAVDTGSPAFMHFVFVSNLFLFICTYDSPSQKYTHRTIRVFYSK